MIKGYLAASFNVFLINKKYYFNIKNILKNNFTKTIALQTLIFSFYLYFYSISVYS